METKKTAISFKQRIATILSKLSSIEKIRDEYVAPISLLVPEIDQQLWFILRQGGALCEIVNMKSLGGIPKDHIQKPTRITVESIKGPDSKKNVATFLAACEEVLFMAPEELFEIKDLFDDDTNSLVRVLPVIESLLDSVVENRSRAKPSKSRSSISSLSSSEILSLSNDIAKSELSKPLAELIETERKYICDLEELQRCKQYLISKNALEEQQSERLFCNLDKLLDSQRRFELKLEPKFYEAFIDRQRYFFLYEAYCNNLRTAQATIKEIEDRLIEFKSPLKARELESFIVKPVQRVCKYSMLISQIIKSARLDEKDPELAKMQEALRISEEVTRAINETQRTNEVHRMWEEVSSRLDLAELREIDTGRIVLADILYKTPSLTYAFLFDNVIMTVSPKETRFKKAEKLIITKVVPLTTIRKVFDISTAVRFELRVRHRSNLDKEELNLNLRFEIPDTLGVWKKTLRESPLVRDDDVGTVSQFTAIIPSSSQSIYEQESFKPQQPQQKTFDTLEDLAVQLKKLIAKAESKPFVAKVHWDRIISTIYFPDIPSILKLRIAIFQKIAKHADSNNVVDEQTIECYSEYQLKFRDSQGDFVSILDSQDLYAASYLCQIIEIFVCPSE